MNQTENFWVSKINKLPLIKVSCHVSPQTFIEFSCTLEHTKRMQNSPHSFMIFQNDQWNLTSYKTVSGPSGIRKTDARVFEIWRMSLKIPTSFLHNSRTLRNLSLMTYVVQGHVPDNKCPTFLEDHRPNNHNR